MLKQGKDSALDWEGWLDKHGAALLLYARQWTLSLPEAEEAVQDGFVRFWRSAYRNAEDALPLLYTCVRRSAMDQGRSRRRRENREQKSLVESGAPECMFESGIDVAERRVEIERALNGLSDEQREVLVMKIWGELTFRQIGHTLSISPNTAASRYRYALMALRDAMGNRQD